MTCTEGCEPSGLAVVSLSRVLGDVRRSAIEHARIVTPHPAPVWLQPLRDRHVKLNNQLPWRTVPAVNEFQ